jgi:photosystem II stability/assembly factor-like uncharacterized protein
MSKETSYPLEQNYTEEGWEDFNLKVEWFMRYRDPRGGRSLKEVYEAAVLQAQKMDRFVHEPPPMPEKVLKKSVIAVQKGRKATVSVVKNPNPRGAIGFVSAAVKISGKGSLLNSVLYIPLDPKLKEKVDSNTICIFHYAEHSHSWTKMPVCGVDQNITLCWARVHEEGTYVAIGLPSDPVSQAALLLLYLNRSQLSPLLKKEDRMNAARKILKGSGRLAVYLTGVLDEPPFGQVEDIVKESRSLRRSTKSLQGMQTPRDLPVPGGFIPEDGFGEWDILEDICPPWFGNKRMIPGRWPRTPILWPTIVYPWPFPWGWKVIGPKNINGRIASLCIHPFDSNILYAGAANGGVWKTVNGGLTWTHKWMHEETMAVGALSLCRNYPDILYAATGEDTPGWGPSYPGVGVYKSIDGGDTWTKCPGTGIGDRCMKVLVHPTDPNTVYIASNIGLFQTTDGGTTWTQIHSGHCTDAVMDPTNPLIIFVAIWNDGIYKTVDGGSFWNAANGKWQWKLSGTSLTYVWRGIPTGGSAEWIALAIGNNGANGTNFLIAKLGPDSGDIYRTTNGGSTWSKIAGPVQAVSYNEWTNMCAVNPDNHNVLFAGGVGLSRAVNGSTFTATSGTHSDHQQLVFDPYNSNICYVATDGGVYKSTNSGQSWSLQSTYLQATQLLSFGIAQDSLLAGGATQDQGIIQTGGTQDWINNGGGNEWGIFVVDPNNGLNIYISPGDGKLRQSTNGGGIWTTLTNGLTDSVGGVNTTPATTYDIAVKSGDSNALLFAGRISDSSISPPYYANKIWRSINKGSSFQAVFNMTDTPTKVLFSPSNGNVAYVTCSNGKVFKSTSSGSSGSWAEPYTLTDKPVSSYISCIAISWYDPNLVLLGYGWFGATRIMRSIDGGAHWTNISGSIPTTALPLIPLNAIAIDQYDSNKIYVGTDIGVFRTTDGGVNWDSYNTGFIYEHPRVMVTGLHLRKSNNALYSGTLGRGAYRRYL